MGEIVAALALSHAPGLTGWLDRAAPEVQRNLTEGYESLGRMLRAQKPDVIIGMPTFIYHVLHEAQAGGVKCPNLCKIVLGGEKAPSGIRRKLRALAAGMGALLAGLVESRSGGPWVSVTLTPDFTISLIADAASAGFAARQNFANAASAAAE